MNREFVLGTIGSLMGWDDERARREFAWLRLMSRMKYDDYQEFLAGMRFVESLADWLQQFNQDERERAYEFIRSKLVYISEAEMRHLAELLYPETIEPLLLASTAQSAGIQRYQIWGDPKASAAFDTLLRKTVFIELSDGARVDVFRRANEGRISHEQVVTSPRIIKSKWDEMLKDLQNELGDPNARFSFVVLIDDFSGSGKSVLRREGDKWKGKLEKFWTDMTVENVFKTHFESELTLIVHHYVATSQAVSAVAFNNSERSIATDGGWFERVEFTWGTVLPQDLKLTQSSLPDFAPLVQKYYDGAIESRHTKVGGGDDIRWGFGNCGLPLVLEHNTPNNSIALLWAESDGDAEAQAMRPLFRRRQRHV